MNKDHAPPQELVDRINEIMSTCWNSKGSIALHSVQTELYWHVAICPGLREYCGGPQDGRLVYTNYKINICKFMRIFDKGTKRSCTFNSGKGDLSPTLRARGTVCGLKVAFIFMPFPLPDSEAAEVFYANGPKEGQVEAKEGVDAYKIKGKDEE